MYGVTAEIAVRFASPLLKPPPTPGVHTAGSVEPGEELFEALVDACGMKLHRELVFSSETV